MAIVKLQKFYPSNNITDAAEANANNSAINGSTGGSQDLNGENVRQEGVAIENMSVNPHFKFQGSVFNQAYAANNTAPTTYNGWIYNAFTIPGTPSGQHYSQTGSVNATFDYPINHDNTFTVSTTANKGTKLQLNGTSGVRLEQHQVIECRFAVNVWDIYYNGTKSRLLPQFYMSSLVDSSKAGVGVGEYYYLIYPKFNTISSALVDDDFLAPQDAGFYTNLGDNDYFTPDDLTNGNSDVQFAFDSRRFDHTTVVPLHMITNGNGLTTGGGRIGHSATYDFTSQEYQSCGPDMMVEGYHAFQVNRPDGGGKTLYGVQLFISGPYRLNSTGQFLESEITDPAGTPVQNGVDVSIVLERAQLQVNILQPATARIS